MKALFSSSPIEPLRSKAERHSSLLHPSLGASHLARVGEDKEENEVLFAFVLPHGVGQDSVNNMSCIFCKIVNEEVTADIVYEDDKIMAFKNIKPVAPVHLLIIPKKHILSVNQLKVEDKELISHLFLMVRHIAKEQGISEKGYRLIINTGKEAGQTVEHLHLHLIGGKKLLWV